MVWIWTLAREEQQREEIPDDRDDRPGGKGPLDGPVPEDPLHDRANPFHAEPSVDRDERPDAAEDDRVEHHHRGQYMSTGGKRITPAPMMAPMHWATM